MAVSHREQAAPPAAGEAYRIARGDPSTDRELILDFWRRVGFFHAEKQARFDQIYLANPVSTARIYLLTRSADGALIGTAGAVSREFATPGGLLRGTLLIDFVVDPSSRTLGPALQLQRALQAEELATADFAYGLPVARAVPVMRRLGLEARFHSGSFVYVVGTRSYLAGRLPRALRWCAPAAAFVLDRVRALGVRLRVGGGSLRHRLTAGVPPLVDELWSARPAPDDYVLGKRNHAYLAWRFGAPGWRTFIVSPPAGAPVAYVVFRASDDDLVIGDFWLPEDEALAGRILARFLELARRMRPRSVRVDFGGSPGVEAVLQRAGFVVRDRRPAYFVWNGGGRPAMADGGWWFTRADEDV